MSSGYQTWLRPLKSLADWFWFCGRLQIHPKLVWTWRFLIYFSFDILYNSRHIFADWNQMSPNRIYLAKCNHNSPFIYSSCGGWMDVLCVFAVDFQHERKFMATHCVCVCVVRFIIVRVSEWVDRLPLGSWTVVELKQLSSQVICYVENSSGWIEVSYVR